MSITQFKNTAHVTLEQSTPVAVPLGSPVAGGHFLFGNRED